MKRVQWIRRKNVENNRESLIVKIIPFFDRIYF